MTAHTVVRSVVGVTPTNIKTGAERTAAARAASEAKRRRARQNRLAGELTERGWLTVPPEKVEAVRAALTAAGVII